MLQLLKEVELDKYSAALEDLGVTSLKLLAHFDPSDMVPPLKIAQAKALVNIAQELVMPSPGIL